MGCPRAWAAPVARVGAAPLPDALDVGGAGEVLAVAWLLEPAVLAGGFARPLTRGCGAVALARGAPRVGSKKGPTMLALPCGAWTSHRPASPQAHDHGIGGWKEENGRRSKQTEEGDNYSLWGRRRNGLTNNFTLAVYIQFLVAADRARILLIARSPMRMLMGLSPS